MARLFCVRSPTVREGNSEFSKPGSIHGQKNQNLIGPSLTVGLLTGSVKVMRRRAFNLDLKRFDSSGLHRNNVVLMLQNPFD